MVNKRTKKIKLFVMDVDGVLTDGGMYYSEKGEVMKKFNTRDGKGIELLRKRGIIPAIITQENSNIVIKRAEKLRIDEVYVSIKNKIEVVKKLIKKYNLNFDEVAYIGDDINDIELLKRVGFSATPKNGVDNVKKVVNYVASKNGGDGAVREVIERILSKSLH